MPHANAPLFFPFATLAGRANALREKCAAKLSNCSGCVAMAFGRAQIATFLHRVRGLTIGYSCYDLFAITNASMSNVSTELERQRWLAMRDTANC